MLQVGQQVYVAELGLVGTVAGIDPRCADGKPCPCCGRGVGVQPLGEPNVSYGVAPAECLPMAHGPAIAGRGGSA